MLSAVEGLEVARPELAEAVLPIGIAILTLLFVVQRWGTHQVGRLFGPVMVLWFGTLAVLGVPPDRRAPRRPARAVADLRRVVLRRPPADRVHRDGRGGAGDHRRRGPLRRHGPLRAAPDPGGVVRPGLPRADTELPRPGGADPDRPRTPSTTPSTCSPRAGRSSRWSCWPPAPRSSPRRR